MGPAAQRLKLSTGIDEIRRLIQPNLAAHQNLVGTDNELMWTVLRYLPCLGLCKGKRTVGSSPAIDLEDPLDRLFVDQRRFDANLEAGGSEQPLPSWARRGENERFTHARRVVAPTIS